MNLLRTWYLNRFGAGDSVIAGGSGGIGRRASLRSWWPKGRRGSSPFFRTLLANSYSTKRESLQAELAQHAAQAGQLYFGFQYFWFQILFEFVAHLARFFPQRF